MRLLNMFLIICFLLEGCTETLKMIPVQDIKIESNIEGVAIGALSGLSILVEAGVWNGPQEVLEKITPLKITIHNKTGKLIKIQYSQFCFKGKNNDHIYAAIPPYEIRGTVQSPCILLPYLFPVKAEMEHNGKFKVAPHCARMYPDLPAYKGSFVVDINYYNFYHNRWASIKIPPIKILPKLIPDGVIENNGYISGYLCFEKIVTTENNVEFCADIFDAKRNQLIGRISIPFCLVKR